MPLSPQHEREAAGVVAAACSPEESVGSKRHDGLCHDVVAFVNENPALGSKAVVAHLKSWLQSQNPKVQLLALEVLDRTMSQCGLPCQQRITDRDFMHTFGRVMKRPNLDKKVEARAIGLVAKWANLYAHDADLMPELQSLRTELEQLGFQMPGGHLRNLYDESYKRGVDGKLRQVVDNAREQAKTVLHILCFRCESPEDLRKHPTLHRLVAALNKDGWKIQRMITDETSGDAMNLLIEANDEIVSVLQKYDAMQRGDMSAVRKGGDKKSPEEDEEEEDEEESSSEESEESEEDDDNGSSSDEEEETRPSLQPRKRKNASSTPPLRLPFHHSTAHVESSPMSPYARRPMLPQRGMQGPLAPPNYPTVGGVSVGYPQRIGTLNYQTPTSPRFQNYSQYPTWRGGQAMPSDSWGSGMYRPNVSQGMSQVHPQTSQQMPMGRSSGWGSMGGQGGYPPPSGQGGRQPGLFG